MVVNMADWEEFLKRYYWESILELAHDYPERRRLIIDFHDIERYDLNAGDKLLEKPDSIIPELFNALRAIDLPLDVEKWAPKVRISNIPEKMKRRDLREEHVNRLLRLDGIVQRVAEVVPRITCAAFQCRRCEHVTYIWQGENKFVEPFECENEVCGRRGPFKLLPEESEKIDSQMIRIQELPEDLRGGEKSQTIDVSMEDDLTGLLLPGNKVTITGILRAYQRIRQNGKTPYFDFFLEAVHIQINEYQESVVLTTEDKKRMYALASLPDIIDRLTGSFGTTIHKMQEIKEGILCSAVSSGLK
jgi:replicative DNA helicase Mcm